MHVVVVGLGTAGAAMAAFAARAGLQVTGLEAGPLDEAGARWVNGVPAWAYDEVGLERPVAPECRSGPVPFHLVAGEGAQAPRATVTSVLEVDMRHLTARLHDAARGSGATLRAGVKVRSVEEHRVVTDDGELEANVVIDASGLTGLGLSGAPNDRPVDLCAAAQEVREVTDRGAAEAWFRSQGAEPGQVVCFTGLAGGYSILNVRFEGGTVGLLSGSLPSEGHPAGGKLVGDFVRTHAWIGERRFGGKRAIPLRRPLEVVGWGRHLWIGDAARMVFAAHGSGIAQQLLAARLFADGLAEGLDPWAINVRWQRRHGGLLASADLLRRATQTLTQPEVAALLRDRVLSAEMSADTMAQRPSRPPLRPLLRALRGLAKHPRLARRLVPALVKGRAVEALYARYPEQPSGLGRWRRRLERLTRQPSWAPR